VCVDLPEEALELGLRDIGREPRCIHGGDDGDVGRFEALAWGDALHSASLGRLEAAEQLLLLLAVRLILKIIQISLECVGLALLILRKELLESISRARSPTAAAATAAAAAAAAAATTLYDAAISEPVPRVPSVARIIDADL